MAEFDDALQINGSPKLAANSVTDRMVEAAVNAWVEAEPGQSMRAAIEAALREQQAESKGGGNLPPPLQAEPVDFVSLLREADEIVRGKPTWKRFIDGTPLSNDIAVWMTVFAQDVARRADPPQRVPLTDEELDALAVDEDGLPNSHLEFARAIERAHGIGGEE